jgi:hypothetical protein
MPKRFLAILTALFTVLIVTGCLYTESAASYHETAYDEAGDYEEHDIFHSGIIDYLEFNSLEDFLNTYITAREGGDFSCQHTEDMAEFINFASLDVIHLLVNLPTEYQLASIKVFKEAVYVLYAIDGDSSLRSSYFLFCYTIFAQVELDEWGQPLPLYFDFSQYRFITDDFIDGKHLYCSRNRHLFWEDDSRHFKIEIPEIIVGFGAEENLTGNDIVNFAKYITINLQDETNISAWSAGDFTMLDDLLERQPDLRFTIDSRSYLHNGTEKQTHTAPFIANGRTMVPLRLIAEALSAEVYWDDTARTIDITRRGETVTLSVNTPFPDDMGIPVIVNNTTFVPLRYISETFGAAVRWDAETRAVYILH